jgi:branched-chain amino acid transport system substrate-binding protein
MDSSKNDARCAGGALSRFGRTIGLLAVVGALLAGCGSSSHSSSTPSSAATSSGAPASTSTSATTTSASGSESVAKCGPDPGKKATGTPIKIGGQTTSSGGANGVEGALAAKAFFMCLNANGGISGHPIDYTYLDDGLNATQAARNAEDLINNDKVVGILSGSYLECPVAGPIYAKAGVFAIDGVGSSGACFTSKNIASTANGAPLAGSAMTQGLIGEDAKSIYLILPNIPGLGNVIEASAKATAKAMGAKIVGETSYAPGVTDASSIVLAAQASGATGIAVAGIKADLVTILKAAETQHLSAKFGTVNQLYSPEIPKELGSYWSGGKLIVQHQYAPEDATTPDVTLWRNVMARYAPKGTALDELSEGEFLGALVFSHALEGIHGPVTRASVATALQHIKDYRSDLLCRPFSWGTLPFRVSNTDTRFVTISNGKWVDDGGCKAIDDPAAS